MPLEAKRIFEALDKEQVDYVILGGIAAIAHGSATLTFDLDVCYARTEVNLERLVRAVSPLNPRLRGADENLPFKFDARTLRNGLNFTFETDAGNFDLLGEVSGVGDYQKVFENSDMLELYGENRRVLTLDALIRAKKAAGRRKDLNQLPELKALLEMKKRHK
jgi:hypothetical protein